MFAKNLKYLREKNGIEQLELAEMIGRKSASTISEWEKEKYTPKLKILNQLSKIFNVSIDDLMEKDLSVPVVFNQIETEKIPVVAQISAGLPVYSEQDIIDYAYAPAYLKKNGRELFYLKVTGDSMDKEFKEGDLILVDMNSTVENGQIGVVQINGYNATVKRVKYDEDKIILLPESNNSDHLPQIYTKDDKVKIIGRVISAQKQY